jgi:hypothetical protein
VKFFSFIPAVFFIFLVTAYAGIGLGRLRAPAFWTYPVAIVIAVLAWRWFEILKGPPSGRA